MCRFPETKSFYTSICGNPILILRIPPPHKQVATHRAPTYPAGSKRCHPRIHIHGRTTTATPLGPWSPPYAPSLRVSIELRYPIDPFDAYPPVPAKFPSIQDIAHTSRVVPGSLASSQSAYRRLRSDTVCPARPQAKGRRGATSVAVCVTVLMALSTCAGAVPFFPPRHAHQLSAEYATEYATYPGERDASNSGCTSPTSPGRSRASDKQGERRRNMQYILSPPQSSRRPGRPAAA